MRTLCVQEKESTVLFLTLMHLCGEMKISHISAQLATASFVWRLHCGDIILLCLHSKARGSFVCVIERQQELELACSGKKLDLAEDKTNPIKLKMERKEEKIVLQWAQKLSSARMLNPISFSATEFKMRLKKRVLRRVKQFQVTEFKGGGYASLNRSRISFTDIFHLEIKSSVESIS